MADVPANRKLVTDADIAAYLGGKANLTNGKVPTSELPSADQIPSFIEAAQDAVAALLRDQNGAPFPYDDAAGRLTIVGVGSGGDGSSSAPGYTYINRSVYSVNSGTSLQLPDTDVASVFVVTLTANAALKFPAPAVGKEFKLYLVQDATGGRSVVWPANIRWNAPTLTAAAGRTDSLEFLCIDGVSWIGKVEQANIAPSTIDVQNPGTPATPTTGIDLTVDDTALTYTGTGWQTGTDPNAFKSGDHYTRTSGDAASFTATYVADGTIAVRAKKAPHHGNMLVTIDNGTPIIVDLYSATEQYQATVYTSGNLAAGGHTIRISALGTKNAAATDVVAEIDSLFLHNAVQGTTGDAPPTTGGGTTNPPTTGGGTTATPTGFLTRTGDKLYLNGSQWRGVGTNLPWSFGCNPTRQPSLAQHQQMFAAATPNSIYRIWLFQGTNLASFDAILNAARPYGHRFVPCLAGNKAGECGDPVRDTGFQGGGWISTGWRDNWLTPVVNRYKNEPLIGWWEWANEQQRGDTFVSFLNGVGSYVRNTLGDKHLIGTGTVSEYGDSAGQRATAASAYVDLVSMHEYDETQYPSNWAAKDAADAASANKPWYVGEFGIRPANDQVGGIKKKLDSYKAMPTCAAAIYWSSSKVDPGANDYEINVSGAAHAVINNYWII